jgi:hypothetical protein
MTDLITFLGIFGGLIFSGLAIGTILNNLPSTIAAEKEKAAEEERVISSYNDDQAALPDTMDPHALSIMRREPRAIYPTQTTDGTGMHIYTYYEMDIRDSNIHDVDTGISVFVPSGMRAVFETPIHLLREGTRVVAGRIGPPDEETINRMSSYHSYPLRQPGTNHLWITLTHNSVGHPTYFNIQAGEPIAIMRIVPDTPLPPIHHVKTPASL